MYRLLIADDEENIRNGIARSLPWQEWGYEVCAVCANGQEVLDQLDACRPDVVLSDIRMPGMDGMELMQRLNRDHPEIKIVILSGYSDFEYLNMSIKNHVAEYLLKPTDFDDFEETFRRLKTTLDHERLQNAQITESVRRHFQLWLTSLLEGIAAPGETERFLPMLTEAGIDLDNLVIAAFTLDGHGGDEQADCCAKQSAFAGQEQIYQFRQLSSERPDDLAYFDTEQVEKALLAQDYEALRAEVDRVLLLPGTAKLDYQTVDRLCLSLLFHISLWALRYGVQMEEVMRSLGAHYTDIHQCDTLTSKRDFVLACLFSCQQALAHRRSYGANPNAKKYAITYTNGALFESYSRLVKQKKIDAIYVVNRHDVLDFLDPNQTTALLIKNFEAMGMDDPGKYGKFYFYPLTGNYLRTESYGEVRRDQVVFGSRRVYSALKSGYPYLHVFSIEEQTLYDLYQLQAKRVGAEVYILTADGGLISSTNEDAVAAGAMPETIAAALDELQETNGAVKIDGSAYDVAFAKGDSTPWTTVLLVPAESLTAATAELYVQTLSVLIVCVGIFALLIFYFYYRFMMPMTQLEEAMRRADAGDLCAYAKPQGPEEVSRMMTTYNSMLDSIRVGLDQQMKMERHKQDLEMQVLMSQINPHFLYNTLETIVWKAGEAGRPDISKMASSLGKLYRLSISGGLFVPLKQELEHVQMYMNIQRIRYGSKIDYEVKLHGCDTAHVETLKLILQPVVENSLLYGMEGLDHVLRIRVAAHHRGDKLILTVTDNGIGMDAETVEKLRQQIAHGRKPSAEKNRRSTGIGLHNIEARLRLYAGASNHVRVQSRPSLGTRVSIELPWNSV